VEALACGVPVVTTDVGGAREAIDRPDAGRLVARTADAFAAAIAELLAAPPAPAAVRTGAMRFTWDRNATELEAHLLAIVGAQASAQ
jgi:glycosyltransferase involved in cell wall biosynthesis